ncbi:MAG: trigger factor [Betaproteobacteria bacterium RIFCSPLOWO2_02_FULL_66_14]|nr:MAG: trigger factor [Betaproteobacteria bacterium RIFCSPLOWO2_02_FULL_66_14]
MAAEVESLGTLERRVSMSVPVAEIERRVDARLKEIARNAKLPGFRPGKVPLKIVARQYGPQVRSEVLSDAVQKAFGEAVKEANLKVAGYPRIDKKEGAAETDAFEFMATFEVYPEVKVGDLASAEIEKPQASIDDEAVEKTLQILRRQRTEWVPVERAAQDGDRLTVDFEGRIGGETFEGGKGTDFALILGEGRLLPGFEAAAQGRLPGESKTFELKFPDDYAGKVVAGKTASFDLSVKRIEEPKLPELDAEFAKRLGIADGDLAKMRAEVRANVEREMKKRIEGRVKSQAMQRLLDVTPVELPKALVQAEMQHLVEMAAADLKARGLKLENVPLDPQAFEANAKRRVALGLIIGELARAEKLQPKPAEVRALIDAEAQSYENPGEMVKWFYMQPQRLSEMESLALENNVVNWVLSRARVADKSVSFDELMGGA